MKIGWRGKWLPDVNDADGGKKKEERQELMGTVVYIHPLGRFYVVRFDCGFCESFFLTGGGECDKPMAEADTVPV
jgi:hypothetical protein